MMETSFDFPPNKNNKYTESPKIKGKKRRKFLFCIYIILFAIIVRVFDVLMSYYLLKLSKPEIKNVKYNMTIEKFDKIEMELTFKNKTSPTNISINKLNLQFYYEDLKGAKKYFLVIETPPFFITKENFIKYKGEITIQKIYFENVINAIKAKAFGVKIMASVELRISYIKIPVTKVFDLNFGKGGNGKNFEMSKIDLIKTTNSIILKLHKNLNENGNNLILQLNTKRVVCNGYSGNTKFEITIPPLNGDDNIFLIEFKLLFNENIENFKNELEKIIFKETYSINFESLKIFNEDETIFKIWNLNFEFNFKKNAIENINNNSKNMNKLIVSFEQIKDLLYLVKIKNINLPFIGKKTILNINENYFLLSINTKILWLKDIRIIPEIDYEEDVVIKLNIYISPVKQKHTETALIDETFKINFDFKTYGLLNMFFDQLYVEIVNKKEVHFKIYFSKKKDPRIYVLKPPTKQGKTNEVKNINIYHEIQPSKNPYELKFKSDLSFENIPENIEKFHMIKLPDFNFIINITTFAHIKLNIQSSTIYIDSKNYKIYGNIFFNGCLIINDIINDITKKVADNLLINIRTLSGFLIYKQTKTENKGNVKPNLNQHLLKYVKSDDFNTHHFNIKNISNQKYYKSFLRNRIHVPKGEFILSPQLQKRIFSKIQSSINIIFECSDINLNIDFVGNSMFFGLDLNKSVNLKTLIKKKKFNAINPLNYKENKPANIQEIVYLFIMEIIKKPKPPNFVKVDDLIKININFSQKKVYENILSYILYSGYIDVFIPNIIINSGNMKYDFPDMGLTIYSKEKENIISKNKIFSIRLITENLHFAGFRIEFDVCESIKKGIETMIVFKSRNTNIQTSMFIDFFFVRCAIIFDMIRSKEKLNFNKIKKKIAKVVIEDAVPDKKPGQIKINLKIEMLNDKIMNFIKKLISMPGYSIKPKGVHVMGIFVDFFKVLLIDKVSNNPQKFLNAPIIKIEEKVIYWNVDDDSKKNYTSKSESFITFVGDIIADCNALNDTLYPDKIKFEIPLLENLKNIRKMANSQTITKLENSKPGIISKIFKGLFFNKYIIISEYLNIEIYMKQNLKVYIYDKTKPKGNDKETFLIESQTTNRDKNSVGSVKIKLNSIKTQILKYFYTTIAKKTFSSNSNFKMPLTIVLYKNNSKEFEVTKNIVLIS